MKKKKKVLALYYTQSGQLKNILDSFTTPLINDSDIELTVAKIEPKKEYPFPWKKFSTFLNIFPECVYNDPPEVALDEKIMEEDYDLIILSYQVWYLSPSLPFCGFLKSRYAKKLLKDKPVITLIGCRNMWLMAQEEVKRLLQENEAKHIDNVVLTDQGNSIENFFTVVRWVIYGRKNKFLFFPPAGVAEEEIKNCSRFGEKLKVALSEDLEKTGEPLLKGMGAVEVNEKLIASEKAGRRNFLIFGKLFRKIGNQDSVFRKNMMYIYMAIFLTLIIAVVPTSILIKTILKPLTKKTIQKQKAYYEKPSGS
ncbi:MAG: dialkylresorcinol condensing enzyme [Gammaproteobacteria bacterium]|nr:MAG: dialkylresorcinol condensing enzyme [Gammaproteobacteria bacterium]